MDETLDAEQCAARAAARRRGTLRDELLRLEDRGDPAWLWAIDGRCYRGLVRAVGLDHLELAAAQGRLLIGLAAIVAVEVPQ